MDERGMKALIARHCAAILGEEYRNHDDDGNATMESDLEVLEMLRAAVVARGLNLG